MIRIVGEPRIIHPLYSRMFAQKFSDTHAIFDMTFDPESNCLDSLQKEKSAQRRQNRSGRPLIYAAAARNVRRFLEVVDVDKSVVGGIRQIEHGKAVRVLL